MERTAQCHCGQLKAIASGEPERVYVCHCKALPAPHRRHRPFGRLLLKTQVRIRGGKNLCPDGR